MTQINPILTTVLGVLTLGVLAVLWWRGAFSRRAFAEAPAREGDLGIPDILATAGIFVAGLLAATSFFRALGLFITGGAKEIGILWKMVVSQAGILLPAAYVVLRGATGVRGGLVAFGFSGRRIGSLLATGVLGAVAMIVLTWAASLLTTVVSTWLGHPPPAIAHSALQAIVDADWGPAKVGFILTVVILAPVVEEILFRGMVQTALLQSRLPLGRWGVIAAASVLFAAMHISAGVWQMLPAIFVLSLGLGYAYERTGSLWPPMVIHALFNVWNVVLALTVIAGSSHTP